MLITKKQVKNQKRKGKQLRNDKRNKKTKTNAKLFLDEAADEDEDEEENISDAEIKRDKAGDCKIKLKK